MPNGPRFQAQNRQGPKTPEKPQTGYELQEGPPPSRVGTMFQANIGGLIGDDVSGWPFTGGQDYIPNVAVVWNPRVPATRQGIPGIDNVAYIPTFAIGDPRGGK